MQKYKTLSEMLEANKKSPVPNVFVREMLKDLNDAIECKLAYNKTRTHRHGGKVA